LGNDFEEDDFENKISCMTRMSEKMNAISCQKTTKIKTTVITTNKQTNKQTKRHAKKTKKKYEATKIMGHILILFLCITDRK